MAVFTHDAWMWIFIMFAKAEGYNKGDSVPKIITICENSHGSRESLLFVG